MTQWTALAMTVLMVLMAAGCLDLSPSEQPPVDQADWSIADGPDAAPDADDAVFDDGEIETDKKPTLPRGHEVDKKPTNPTGDTLSGDEKPNMLPPIKKPPLPRYE